MTDETLTYKGKPVVWDTPEDAAKRVYLLPAFPTWRQCMWNSPILGKNRKVAAEMRKTYRANKKRWQRWCRYCESEKARRNPGRMVVEFQSGPTDRGPLTVFGTPTVETL